MLDIRAIARAASELLTDNPHQLTIEIDTPEYTSAEVLALIDAIYEECAHAGVIVKGVRVDPMQVLLPANAEFVNAFLRRGRLVIVDLDVDDKLIVRRK
jgi:hypothetical protein